ncbi:MAG: cytochrome b [Pseudomonadota bacterium]
MAEYSNYIETGEMRGYSLAMRIIHWLMALIMIWMMIAGILMVNVYNKFDATTNFLYHQHRGFGFVLLILVVVRLVLYRFNRPPSPLPAGMSPAQKLIAEANHFLLYLALILHPLLGWYATNAWGVKDIPIFGLFTLPPLVEKNRELGDFLLMIHGYVGFAIVGLVALHILGALWHLSQGDGVFSRMLKSKITTN